MATFEWRVRSGLGIERLESLCDAREHLQLPLPVEHVEDGGGVDACGQPSHPRPDVTLRQEHRSRLEITLDDTSPADDGAQHLAACRHIHVLSTGDEPPGLDGSVLVAVAELAPNRDTRLDHASGADDRVPDGGVGGDLRPRADDRSGDVRGSDAHLISQDEWSPEASTGADHAVLAEHGRRERACALVDPGLLAPEEVGSAEAPHRGVHRLTIILRRLRHHRELPRLVPAAEELARRLGRHELLLVEGEPGGEDPLRPKTAEDHFEGEGQLVLPHHLVQTWNICISLCTHDEHLRMR